MSEFSCFSSRNRGLTGKAAISVIQQFRREKNRSPTGLPDFSRYNIPKWEKSQNVLNGQKSIQFSGKIDKMVIKIPTSSIARPSKIYPNCEYHLATLVANLKIVRTFVRSEMARP
jgi:hypothetical protein